MNPGTANQTGSIPNLARRQARQPWTGMLDETVGHDDLAVADNGALFHVDDVDMIEDQVCGQYRRHDKERNDDRSGRQPRRARVKTHHRRSMFMLNLE
jgi:hypothetical protein